MITTARPSSRQLHRSPSRSVAGLALLAWVAMAQGALLMGCVAESTGLSTDTGNPPAIDEHALHVSEKSPGQVEVYGDPGAISVDGAKVTVSNASGKASTTAAADGSFSVTLSGSASDDYTIEVEGDGVHEEVVLEPDTDPGAGALDVSGHNYELESAMGYQFVMGTSLSVGFTETDFSFNAGCNGYGGSYSVCDGKLCLEDMYSTAIGCDPERHTQDEWFGEFFSAEPKLALDGDRLTVESADAKFVLLDREVANPDRSLTGRVWSIDTFFRGGVAGGGMLATPPTVSFDEDGTVHVFSGCNSGEGSFEAVGNTLELGAIAYTEKGCEDESLMAAEADVQEVLQEGTVSIEISAARLTLMRGDVGLGATTE
jgi:heat shock protein HslJ